MTDKCERSQSPPIKTARKLIRQHRALVDTLVDLLVEQETIEGEQFRQIVAEHAQLSEKSLAASSKA